MLLIWKSFIIRHNKLKPHFKPICVNCGDIIIEEIHVDHKLFFFFIFTLAERGTCVERVNPSSPLLSPLLLSSSLLSAQQAADTERRSLGSHIVFVCWREQPVWMWETKGGGVGERNGVKHGDEIRRESRTGVRTRQLLTDNKRGLLCPAPTCPCEVYQK